EQLAALGEFPNPGLLLFAEQPSVSVTLIVCGLLFASADETMIVPVWMSETKLLMSTEMNIGVESLGATAGVTMLLTLSQLPPFTVAASALQWRVTPPVFLRI